MRDLTQPLNETADRLRAEQLTQWQSGCRVLIEGLLAPHPALDDETLLDLIYGEVLLREEHGERPRLEEYQRRFPHLAEPLRRQFELHEALASADGAASIDSVNGSATQVDLAAKRRASPSSMPERIGQYEVLEEIGRGGMGVVYKARHVLISSRIAAIKVIRPGSGTDLEALKARWKTEGWVTAALDHPNIVRMYELELADVDGEELPTVALEYIEGGNLAQAINGTPLPPREAAALLHPLADAVAHAHSRGILHRDLKPANVLLANGTNGTDGTNGTGLAGNPKITDFGLAKRLDTDSGQTRTGTILGTPSYMAPEQASGQNQDVGPGADVYALGAILYEMLTGRPPFKADTILNTLHQVTTFDVVPPRILQPGTPRDLETVCLKCLEKQPDRRYLSARALGEDLERYLEGQPILARPASMGERVMKWVQRRPAAAALLGVSVLALAGIVALWAFFTVQLQDEKREAIKQRDEADRQKGIAVAQSEEARKQSERAAHILALAASSVDDIAMQVRGAKQEELESGNTGSVLFKLACSYARTSATLKFDDALILEDRMRLSEQYAVSAVRLLRCAQGVKFFRTSEPNNLRALETNKDLDILRERPDFKAFVAQLRL